MGVVLLPRSGCNTVGRDGVTEPREERHLLYCVRQGTEQEARRFLL